jgi:hypothetical protein
MAAAKTTSISPLAGFQHEEARHEPREQHHALAQFEEVERKISDGSVERSDVARIASLLSTTVLKASPYAGPEHLLHLDTLEIQNRLMALALSSLSPARPDYATADYQQAFDWDQVVALLATLAREQRMTWEKQSFYVVEFRSKLKENIDNDRLYLLDKQSHMEATASGGLLKYWYGIPDSERYNLATCKDIHGPLSVSTLTSSRSLAEQRRCSQRRPWTLAQTSASNNTTDV